MSESISKDIKSISIALSCI